MPSYSTSYKYNQPRYNKYHDATETYIHNKLIREYKIVLKALINGRIISPREAKRRLQAYLFIQFARPVLAY